MLPISKNKEIIQHKIKKLWTINGGLWTNRAYSCTMQFPSKLIEDAVHAFATLPGIGKKTALRLVMHLLQHDVQDTKYLTESVLKMRQDIKFCIVCHNVSDGEICRSAQEATATRAWCVLSRISGISLPLKTPVTITDCIMYWKG